MIGGQKTSTVSVRKGAGCWQLSKKKIPLAWLISLHSLPFLGQIFFFLLVPILHINKVSRGDPFCFLGGRGFLGASALPKPPPSAHPPATLFFLVFSRVCGERSTHLGFLLFYIYIVLGGCKMIGNFLDQASK